MFDVLSDLAVAVSDQVEASLKGGSRSSDDQHDPVVAYLDVRG